MATSSKGSSSHFFYMFLWMITILVYIQKSRLKQILEVCWNLGLCYYKHVFNLTISKRVPCRCRHFSLVHEHILVGKKNISTLVFWICVPSGVFSTCDWPTRNVKNILPITYYSHLYWMHALKLGTKFKVIG